MHPHEIRHVQRPGQELQADVPATIQILLDRRLRHGDVLGDTAPGDYDSD